VELWVCKVKRGG